MFCPTCGREETQERKFCTACGTNLERVTQALSPHGDGPLTGADKAFDQLMARYAGTFFSSAANKADDWRLKHSWQLLGHSCLAAVANILLLAVMFYLAIPIRFVSLLFSTAFRLLSERSSKTDRATADLPTPQWSADTIMPSTVMPSITEHATMKMDDAAVIRRSKVSR